MPFRSKDRTFYKTRVTLPDGREIVAGCGTDDLDVAKNIEAMIRKLKRQRGEGLEVLTLIVERKEKLTTIFDAYERNELTEFLARRNSPDLETLLDKWNGQERYKTQIRQFVKGRKASEFTKRNLSEFLAGLPHSGSTRNRYRAALSVFAKWLVERDIIPHNPLRDVAAYKPNEARMIWLERNQAKALIAALPEPHRSIEALMYSCGVEWQVIERLMRRDVDLKERTVHARGGKTRWRNRVVRPLDDESWAIFAEHCRTLSPNAPVFPAANKWRTLRAHRNASKVLGLPDTTLHDWRHTFAVNGLKDGYLPTVLANNLGHRDTYLLLTRYARHVPSALDYQTRVVSRVTDDSSAFPRNAQSP